MKLYFKNSQGGERLIAECETLAEIHEAVSDFINERNPEFKVYYTRSWGDDSSVTLDVGSHSEFFVIKGISFSEYVRCLQNDEEPEKYHQITMDEYLESLQTNRE